ncbi:MAG: hypothetical protein NT069_05905, partial [Planctomycetota bacterium]|nr:hypothetical protein [Planctomycetota bacterium]
RAFPRSHRTEQFARRTRKPVPRRVVSTRPVPGWPTKFVNRAGANVVHKTLKDAIPVVRDLPVMQVCGY